ncbi:MAG: hypothetical protein IPI57_13810 [Candidatus Competibacteraceae bacterium]|nr:hypothetical protein [Candidatus Competibacteraceae bacterium]
MAILTQNSPKITAENASGPTKLLADLRERFLVLAEFKPLKLEFTATFAPLWTAFRA